MRRPFPRQNPRETMIVAIDVDYRDDAGYTACVSFADWEDSEPQRELTTIVHDVEPYVSGQFWQREMPCILAVLDLLASPPSLVVVDGYVWLDGNGQKGLGAHLHEALRGEIPVIGVAKRPFKGASHAIPVLRGGSQRPLHITSAGVSPRLAAEGIAAMHGEHRMPTLLKRVDQLCRCFGT